MKKKHLIIVGTIIISAIVILGLYQTFALSGDITKDTSGNYQVTVNDGTTVNVPANSSKTVYYKLTNANKGTVKYGVGYSGSNITVRFYSDTQDPVTGTVDYGKSKFIKLYVENTGTTASTVTLSTVLGYEHGGDLIVPSGVTLFSNALATGKAGETLKKLNLELSSGTPDFSKTSEEDGMNGIYASIDDDGASYYFRGKVENNYFSFAELYWRIVRINGDGSIRLVYAGTSAHANGEITSDVVIGTSTYADDPSDISVFNFDKSTAFHTIYDWFSTNVSTNQMAAFILEDNTFCADYSTLSGITTDTVFGEVNDDDVVFSLRKRIFTDYSPSLKCNSDRLSLPFGLITADEMVMAGAGVTGDYNNSSNNKFYLYASDDTWTMSPVYYYGPESNSDPMAFIAAYIGGTLEPQIDSTNELHLRPVINITISPENQIIEITGTGTKTDPFVANPMV